VRDTIKAVNQELSKLDDGNSVRFLDPADVFLKPDRSIDVGLMPDLLHPDAAGYQAWGEFMSPLVAEMMK
jgi:beta-glucosidase